MGERSRSRSPGRRREGDRDRPKKAGGGFRWKEKRRDDNDRPDADDRQLNRGYRDRARSPRRDRGSDRYREEDRPRRHTEREGRDANDDDNRPRDGDREPRRSEQEEKEERRKRKEEKRERKKAAAVQAAEPTMVVYVNDRLGTKAAIPCLASDPIKLFKAQVAAQIGREPHEILLKRQGERPFKDFLTLADYSVSHGAQLDLEVGTGD
ncbi:hypothetical protein FE257_012567 [Aspergillus nanangensis]|uniref:Ubiquitin-like modifier HUB1 n=1 Tax=Aspergillus nanangensis TaxID=2582783 RepID=A0AAD4GXW5_ASPNN|nr:hypothetical protein FE257_012567 [Aspergillus nanangensis]